MTLYLFTALLPGTEKKLVPKSSDFLPKLEVFDSLAALTVERFKALLG